MTPEEKRAAELGANLVRETIAATGRALRGVTGEMRAKVAELHGLVCSRGEHSPATLGAEAELNTLVGCGVFFLAALQMLAPDVSRTVIMAVNTILDAEDARGGPVPAALANPKARA